MRSYVFLLISFWLLGLGSAVWQVMAYVWLLALAGLLLLWSRRASFALQMAGLGVAMVGYLYGHESVPTTVVCQVRSPLTASVVEQIELGGERARYVVATQAGCRVLLTVARFPAFKVGDVVSIVGKPETIATLAQELPGYAEYLTTQRISATWRYPKVRLLDAAPPSAGRVTDLVTRRIQQNFVEPDASVVQALVLANDDLLPKQLKENFRATGLSHLLAISGMNISLLALGLLVVIQLLPLSAGQRALLLVSLLWAYMAMIGWPISAVRATLFWTIALLAFRLHRLVSLTTVILLTALLMVSLEPQLLRDISWQLSLGAVAGIFVTAILTGPWLSRQALVTKLPVGALLVTGGATLATMPIIAFHFGTLSLTSMLANLLVAPAVTLQMLAAAVTLLVSLVLPVAAFIPSYIFHLTIRWMDLVSSVLAAIPGGFIQELTVTPFYVVSYYAFLALVCIIWLRYQRRSWREVWV